MLLDAVAQRVLGALMEKEMTTPELYPLSLNALQGAANQKSSRDPVMNLSDDEVRSALSALEEQGLVSTLRDGRVLRFEHTIRTALALRRDETALLCLLLLRGAQTPGELRGRAERMFAFDDVPQVQSALERLAARPEPLAIALARASGAREVRWRHRLGEPAADGNRPALATVAGPAPAPPAVLAELLDRVAALEERIRQLEDRLREQE